MESEGDHGYQADSHLPEALCYECGMGEEYHPPEARYDRDKSLCHAVNERGERCFYGRDHSVGHHRFPADIAATLSEEMF